MKNNSFVLMLIMCGAIPAQLFAAAEPAQSERRFLRLTICVDDDGQENIEDQSRSTAITADFATAVHQKAAPILVSSNTLRNFLLGQQKFKHANLSPEGAHFPGAFERVSQIKPENRTASQEKLLNDYRYHHLFYNVPFTDQQWSIYQFNNIFLLIPNDYKERIMQSTLPLHKADQAAINAWKESHRSTLMPEEIALGFRLNRGKKKTITSLRQNAQELPKQSQLSLSNVLVNGRGAPFGVWNITIVGHGLFAKKMKDGFTPTPNTPAHAQYEEQNGSIAGTSISDFRNMLAFLAQSVDTNLLYYDTCFGGGMNTVLPYVELLQKASNHYVSPVQPNFIVVSGALTDASTRISVDFLAQQVLAKKIASNIWATPEAQKRGKNFVAFFDMLEAFFSQKKRVGAALSKSPLRDILKEISAVTPDPDDDPHGITSIPLIRFPGVPFFRAVDVDNRVAVLTQALVTKYELENQPIEVHNKDAILFYTHAVRVPIKITDDRDKVPAFVSMIPGMATHFIQEVKANKDIFSFLREGFGSVETLGNKQFLIERLFTQPGGDSGVFGRLIIDPRKRGSENPYDSLFQELSQDTHDAITFLSFTADGMKVLSTDEHGFRTWEKMFEEDKKQLERKPGVDLSMPLGAYESVRKTPLTTQEVRERAVAEQRAVLEQGPNAALTQVLVTQHELENTPIDIHNRDSILLHTHAVRVPINITDDRGKTPAFASMISGAAHHFLKEVNVNFSQEPTADTDLRAFLHNGFGTLEVAARKQFLIERLALHWPVNIQIGDRTIDSIQKYFGTMLIEVTQEGVVFLYTELSDALAPVRTKRLLLKTDRSWEESEYSSENLEYLVHGVKEEVKHESGVDLSTPLGTFAGVRKTALTEEEEQERRMAVQKSLQEQGYDEKSLQKQGSEVKKSVKELVQMFERTKPGPIFHPPRGKLSEAQRRFGEQLEGIAGARPVGAGTPAAPAQAPATGQREAGQRPRGGVPILPPEVQEELERKLQSGKPILRPTPERKAKMAQPKKPTFLAMNKKPRRPKRPVFLQQRVARRTA